MKHCTPALLCTAAWILLCVGGLKPLQAQEAGADQPGAAAAAAAEGGLAQTEAQLKQRYDRLELLVGRLAELSGPTQPRRAALLRQLITQSRERDVAGQFDRVVAALEQESYSTALDGQNALEGELQRLLDLLLQEDRDRQIESERKRIGRYLQDLNRIIRLQRGVKARTDGGDEADELAEDQQHVGDRTKDLGDEIEQKENSGSGKQGDSSPSQPADNDQKPGEQATPLEEGKQPSSDPSQPEPSESDGQQPSGDSSQAPPGQPTEGQPKPSAPSQSQGSPSGQPQSDPTQQPPDQTPGTEQQPQQSTPMQRAADRLRRAQQRMGEAQKRLEESKRDGAAAEQEKAVEQLERAKAELERILRQLREEELERMLVMLEARFRKMLDDQVEVYEETKKLDAAVAQSAAHEVEIAGGRLSRKEQSIVREADRALVLLREDGTSVAFPEAIEQARDDMQMIAERLQDAKFELITQGLEEDVIEALEETLASLQQTLKELREQKAGQGQPSSGQPGEQPLVCSLEELRMIRSLQKRVKVRTERYGALIEGEQAVKGELLEALDELALRQQKIFQATRELSLKELQAKEAN